MMSDGKHPIGTIAGSMTTLGGQVQELESTYADLHRMTGELLATLTVPKNREMILAGDREALARLMVYVDGWKKKYEQFPPPGAAFTSDTDGI